MYFASGIRSEIWFTEILDGTIVSKYYSETGHGNYQGNLEGIYTDKGDLVFVEILAPPHIAP